MCPYACTPVSEAGDGARMTVVVGYTEMVERGAAVSVVLIAVLSLLAARPAPGLQPYPRVALIRCPQLSELHQAAAAGDTAKMEALVRAGAKIDEDLACHGTPLRQAVQAGQTEAVRWLVKRGARVGEVLDDAVDSGNLSNLTFLLRAGKIDLGTRRDDLCARAAERGHSRILRWLLEQKPPSPQSSLDAALRAAARSGQFEQADWLLSKGARVDGADAHGQTALHLVAGARAADLTRLLLSAGARVDAVDGRGTGPLHRAAFRGQTAVVKLLLEANAPPDAADADGESPLLRSLSFTSGGDSWLEIIRMLLAAGADPNRCDNQGVSGLMRAVQGNHTQAAALLLAAGADATLGAQVEFSPLWSPGHGLSGYHSTAVAAPPKSGRGWTALHMAAMVGQQDLAGKLLARGVKINSPSPTGKTPLWVAAAFGRADMVGLLLARGADPKRTDTAGRTPLHAAVLAGSQEGVGKLLAAGLRLQVRDQAGRTALHLACTPVTTTSWPRFGRGQTSRQEELPARRAIAETLISRRAKLESPDAKGQTPLHLAAAAGLSATVDTLLLAGASVRAEDGEGRMPLQLARASGHQDVAETLRCWARNREKRCLATWREEQAKQAASRARAKAEAKARREAEAEARVRAKALLAAEEKNAQDRPAGDGGEKVPWIEQKRREQLRQQGQRAWALVAGRKESDAEAPIAASGEYWARCLVLRFKTPKGQAAFAELCQPFPAAAWKRIRLGAKLEVVYLPDSLMRVGQDLVAAEIALARDVFP